MHIQKVSNNYYRYYVTWGLIFHTTLLHEKLLMQFVLCNTTFIRKESQEKMKTRNFLILN